MRISFKNSPFFFLIVLLSVTSVSLSAQTEQKGEMEEYTRVITGRADKIVDAMTFYNSKTKTYVRDVIVEHYRFLNDNEELRNNDVAKIKEEYADNKELRNAKIDLRKAEQEIKTRDHHYAFYAQLKSKISEEQIDQVKDGLTYGVLNVTYFSYCEMIPSLKAEEKEQMRVWLLQAREHAIDGGSSREKHGWFGKYKGRMNNYLSARGYDLQEERRQWEARLAKEEENK